MKNKNITFCFICLVVTLISCVKKESNNIEGSKVKQPNIILLIADDWSYPHASIHGDAVVQTPNFDKLADKGTVFTNAFCAAPTCSPSRASILTGRYPHQLREAASLYGSIPDTISSYVQIMEKHGYEHGYSEKGWAPGTFENTKTMDNPAGKYFMDFQTFIEQRDEEKPFVFWYGSYDPHRTYQPGLGQLSEMKARNVEVPDYLPDTKEVRNDLLDYRWEVERFDRRLGEIVRLLKLYGEYENTIIAVTSDNGMPFPRSKANIYDAGTHVPLAISWANHFKNEEASTTFVNLIDLFPTFLDLAGIKDYPTTAAKSLVPILQKEQKENRSEVFLERERHSYSRANKQSYPVRAIRNNQFLLIHNLSPDRYPSGDPEHVYSVGSYGDNDASPSKNEILKLGESSKFFELTYKKRPKWELYDVKNDKYQIHNLASDKTYAKVFNDMKIQLATWQKQTNDLRAIKPDTVFWDNAAYSGGRKKLEDGNKNGTDIWNRNIKKYNSSKDSTKTIPYNHLTKIKY